MIFSLSSCFYAFITGMILSIVFLFLLNTKTLYSVIHPKILVFFSLLIIGRFLVPGELFFAKTISTTFFVPDMYDFIKKDIFFGYNMIDMFLLIWIAGSVLFLLTTLSQLWKGYRQLELIKENAAMSILSKSSAWNTAKKDIKVFRSGYVCSPFSAGLKEAAIFLPEKEYDPEKLHWILHHESTHIHNKDLWKNIGFRLITIVLWWFVPVYIFRKLFTLFQEIRVDQKVLEFKNETEGINYARFLIEEIETQKSALNQNLNLATFSTLGGWMMGKRLSYILDEKRKGYLNVAFCVLMGILVLFGFCFVIEPDYSNSEYSKQQFEGTYGEEDFTHGEIQEDGSVECYLDNGESISFPSEELVNTIFPNLEIKKES